MARQLRTHAVFVEDLVSIPSTHTAAPNWLQLQSLGSSALPWPLSEPGMHSHVRTEQHR